MCINTHPCPCPDIRSQVEDGQLKHEVDPRHNLGRAGGEVDQAPECVKDQIDFSIAADSHT